MEYRVLGRTGIRVSAFGIGTWQLSGPVQIDGVPDGYPDRGETHALELIRGCGDLGLNLIDTAEIYGDGEGERRVGKAVRGQRDRWIIATKFGLRRGAAGNRIEDPSPETITRSLEGSLRRLQSDYVDILLYHSPPRPEHLAAGKDVLERLKTDGKIRAYGVSSNEISVIKPLQERGGIDVVLFSQSLLRQPQQIRDLIKDQDLGGLVRGALEWGRLTGRFTAGPAGFAEGDIRSHLLRGEDFRRFSEFERFVPANGTLLTLALRYVLDFETSHAVVLGAGSLDGYRNALEALEMPRLEGELRERLEALGRKLAGPRWSLTAIARRLLRILRAR